MRISIINLNLVAQDAIGQCILHQVRFFRRRGDTVQIYVMYPPEGIAADIQPLVQEVNLATLIGQHDQHFVQSDLYIYHYPSRYPLLESIKGLDRGAVILYYHNVTPPELWGSSFVRHDLRHALDSVSSVASYADLIVTDSQYNAKQLVEEHDCDEEGVQVLPLAVPLEEFSPGAPEATLLRQYNLEGRAVILFVGRMAGNKRPDLLVEALPLVQAEIPNALLLLVGDNKSNPAIQEMVARSLAKAKELGVAEDVIFTGKVEQIAPYFRLADVYATASLHEGFGVPLIEAMASGVPVVASRVTTHPWVLGEAGLLVEPNNPTEMAEALIKVLSNDKLRGELVRQGLSRVRDFSQEQYEIGWSRIVSEATAWLPNQLIPRSRSLLRQPVVSEPTPSKEAQPEVQHIFWLKDIKEKLSDLWQKVDVMQRGYSVRSNLPVVGPMIAWIRINLTSHLWQPYIDPTFERQVAFNQQLSNLMEEVVAQLNKNNIEIAANSRHRLKSEKFQQDASQRLRRLERQLDLLSTQMTLLSIQQQGEMDSYDVMALRKEIERLKNEIR